ncbi:hypothetical protein BG910_02975 [Neisseria chenwenguii]|uniref:Uncharacterized protein n=1 Tax=Neisseria chenwenguii TaxID=1853278 RepID=A0A220S035_9NEIS|nr:hypothetical protein BG910_02975 [Neisseria chenwenguii]ROV56819.1 hypothetical protein EGS38_02990 [Neisseria chenwenguii]
MKVFALSAVEVSDVFFDFCKDLKLLFRRPTAVVKDKNCPQGRLKIPKIPQNLSDNLPLPPPNC